jgi:DNA-binding MarR family transcriptional regulator
MFDHCLYFNSTALARGVERVWTQAFAPFDVTPSQGFLLRCVLEAPGSNQHVLASELAISRPTATRIIDGLEAKGLIERRAANHDARHLEIYPTARAEALRDALNDASAEVTRQLRKLLGPDMFDNTVAHLRTARNALTG